MTIKLRGAGPLVLEEGRQLVPIEMAGLLVIFASSTPHIDELEVFGEQPCRDAMTVVANLGSRADPDPRPLNSIARRTAIT